MSNKGLTSYDLWSSWRDFNQTGVDQSEGATSVLNEDAGATESQALAEKSSSIVAEIGQLAPATRKRLRTDPRVKGVVDSAPVGSAANPIDLPDTESELVHLYNYLISMGISREDAEKMVNNALDMLPDQVKESVDVVRLFEACGCGGASWKHNAISVPEMGRDFNYDSEHSDEGIQARDQLLVINYLSGMLMNTLHDEDELPAWVQAYITEAELLVQKTFKYLVPHMQRVETGEAQQASQGGDGNVIVVATESKVPTHSMKSRADARVRKAVKSSRKTGKMTSIKLTDIFDS